MRYRKWGIEKKIHTAKSHIRGRNPATTDPSPPCVPIIKQGKESNKPSSKGLYVASVASVISPAVTWHNLLQPHLQQQVSCWLWWQPGGNHSFPLCNCLDYKEWESGFCFIIYSSSSLFSFPLRVTTCTYPWLHAPCVLLVCLYLLCELLSPLPVCLISIVLHHVWHFSTPFHFCLCVCWIPQLDLCLTTVFFSSVFLSPSFKVLSSSITSFDL